MRFYSWSNCWFVLAFGPIMVLLFSLNCGFQVAFSDTVWLRCTCACTHVYEPLTTAVTQSVRVHYLREEKFRGEARRCGYKSFSPASTFVAGRPAIWKKERLKPESSQSSPREVANWCWKRTHSKRFHSSSKWLIISLRPRTLLGGGPTSWDVERDYILS